MPAGRPTKYKPEFCQKLIDHMSQGLSYESFSAVVDVHLDTLYEWESKYPTFSESKKLGRQKQRITFEKMGINAAMGRIPNFNATAYVWLSKNMLGWRDKQDVQISGSESSPLSIKIVDEAANMTESELKSALKKLLKEESQ